VHLYVLEEIVGFAEEIGFHCANLTFSPITGGEGNIEFLAHFTWQKNDDVKNDIHSRMKEIVEEAHTTLK